MVLESLLHPERCTRLVDQRRRDPRQLSLEELQEALTDHVFKRPTGEPPRARELRRIVQAEVVYSLFRLADDPAAPQVVRSRTTGRLRRLVDEDWVSGADSESEAAHIAELLDDVLRFLDRRPGSAPVPAEPLNPPPGSPIGSSPQAYPHPLGDCCSRFLGSKTQ